MSDELDLEELESRLYGQIHHGTAEEIPENNYLPSATLTATPRYISSYSISNIPKSNNRYFETNRPVREDDFIPLNSTSDYWIDNTSNSAQNNLLVPPPDVYSNNTVLNPIAAKQRQDSSVKRSKTKTKLSREKRKAKRKEKKNMRKKEMQAMQEVSHDSLVTSSNTRTVFVSDSDDDCVVSTENSEAQPSKHASKSAEVAQDDDDNEVIFIESPPIEVINLDPDDTNDESPIVNKNTSKNIVTDKNTNEGSPSDSNDFLDNSAAISQPTQFNFSLHGADFDNGEFVRPANPDPYETESSCSTSDLNKDHPLNTIVFNEVDFPRDDIFAENNLESFGNYITPKRAKTAISTNESTPTRAAAATKSARKNSEKVSSDSSSESDYDEQTKAKQNKHLKIGTAKSLPELSPMHSNEVSSKYNTSLINTPAKEPQTQSSQKRKQNVINTETILESIRNEILLETKKQLSMDKKRKKKKKKDKSDQSILVGQTAESEISIVEDTSVVIEPQPADDETVKSKKKKRKRMSTSTSETQTQTDVSVNTSTSTPQTQNPVEENQPEEPSEPAQKIPNTNAEPPVAVSKKTELKSIEKAVVLVEAETVPIINFDELTIIDEVASTSTMEPISVDDSSQSDCDFQTFADVGNDLQLANCSKKSARNNVDFDVDDIRKGMSDNPSQWKILSCDKEYFHIPVRGPRCFKCRHVGHMAIRCPNKPNAARCKLCGDTEHLEPRCPNTRCTQCGNKGDYSTTFCWKCVPFRNKKCSLCHMMGHHENSCPDVWRRYHLTTKEGPLVTLQYPQLKPPDKLWCSACASCGHLEHNCYYINREYPPTDPCIHSYQDVYRRFYKQNQPAPVSNSRTYSMTPSTSRDCVDNVVIEVPNYREPQNSCQNQYIDFSSDRVINPVSFASQTNVNYLPLVQQPIPSLFDLRMNEMPPLRPPVSHTPNLPVMQKQNRAISIPKASKVMFMSAHVPELQEFLQREISTIDRMIDKNPKKLRKQLLVMLVHQKKPNISKNVKREMETMYRNLNMLIFGFHQFRDGKRHLDYLKGFLNVSPNVKVTTGKRSSLMESYNYVFGNKPHLNTDYNKFIRNVISKTAGN